MYSPVAMTERKEAGNVLLQLTLVTTILASRLDT